MIKIGSVVIMARDSPFTGQGVFKGDIGIVNEFCGNHYQIHFYDKNNPLVVNGDFRIPRNYVKEYHYKTGDRVEIINPKSKYKGYFATVYKEYHGRGCSNSVQLFVDETTYQPSEIYNKTLTLIVGSVKPISSNDKKGSNGMKLSGFNRVAVIDYHDLSLHYALYDESINVGDNVLVTGRLEDGIHTVKDIITLDEARERFSGDIVAEVKCKVDLSAYNERVNNRIEADKLRKKMNEEIKKMDEIAKYKIYAEQNPELKEMLDRLLALKV